MTTPKPIHTAHPHKPHAQTDCCQAEEQEIASAPLAEPSPPKAKRKKAPPAYYHREIF